MKIPYRHEEVDEEHEVLEQSTAALHFYLRCSTRLLDGTLHVR